MRILKTILFSLLTTIAFYNQAMAVEPNQAPITVNETNILYVNVNTADLEMLADLLVGVGEKKARAIIDYREQVGLFTTADDLLAVNGIGPAILEKNRAAILTETQPQSES